MIDVATYKANGSYSPQWTGYCILDNEILWVRFEGATEKEVIERANAWYANEADHQRRLVGRHELSNDDVPSKPYKSNWESPKGSVATNWGDEPDEPSSTHKMNGKVWLVHHSQQKRARVAPEAVEAMIAQGWERGGPKTVFKGGW